MTLIVIQACLFTWEMQPTFHCGHVAVQPGYIASDLALELGHVGPDLASALSTDTSAFRSDTSDFRFPAPGTGCACWRMQDADKRKPLPFETEGKGLNPGRESGPALQRVRYRHP